MDRKLVALILVPISILMIIVPAQIIPRAWAPSVLTGIVCVAQATDTKCPTPVSFNGPLTSPRSVLRVPIFINQTDTINGFDITLKVGDTTKLVPYDADLAGSVLPSPVVLVKCIAGVKVLGSTCNSATDTADTIHLSVVTQTLLPSGTTGLLFTALFNITGTTAAGGTTIDYQTGCNNSSVASTTTCVSMPNGTTTPTPETVQAGSFDNSNTTMLPYATMTSAKTTLGQFLSGLAASTTDVLTITPVNGFETSSSPTVTMNSPVSVTTTTIAGAFPLPAASLSSYSLTFASATPMTSTLSALISTGTGKGNDTVTVVGTYVTTDQSTFLTSSLEVIAVLPVAVLDFSVTANPATISNTAVATSAQTTIKISPVYFGGLVKLGLQTSGLPSGVTASYSVATITSPATSALTFTIASNAAFGPYAITITSNSTLNGVTRSHTSTVTLNVQGHSVTIDSVTVSPQGPVGIGTTVTFTVQVDNKGAFNETVTVNAIASNVTVATKKNVAVPANSVVTVMLPWTTNTSGTFTLSANVLVPSNEKNIATNSSSVPDPYIVQPAAPSPLSDPTILAIIAVIVVVAVIGTVLLLRRRKTSPAPM